MKSTTIFAGSMLTDIDRDGYLDIAFLYPNEGEFKPQKLMNIDYSHPMDNQILLHDFTGDNLNY